MKKEYVSISVRVPLKVHESMADIKDKLELTTNTLVANAIEDWIEIALCKKDLPTRLEIARFAIGVKSRKEK